MIRDTYDLRVIIVRVTQCQSRYLFRENFLLGLFHSKENIVTIDNLSRTADCIVNIRGHCSDQQKCPGYISPIFKYTGGYYYYYYYYIISVFIFFLRTFYFIFCFSGPFHLRFCRSQC